MAPRFFCLPLYVREKYGHPISGAVVRFAHPERHRWTAVPGRTLRNSAGPSNKEWPYVHTRQVPLLPLEPPWTLYEHCTLFPATIRASWRVALVFHRSGAAAAFYRPFSKVPSCDRPAPSRYCTCPLSLRNAVCRRQAGERGRESSFDQKER